MLFSFYFLMYINLVVCIVISTKHNSIQVKYSWPQSFRFDRELRNKLGKLKNKVGMRTSHNGDSNLTGYSIYYEVYELMILIFSIGNEWTTSQIVLGFFLKLQWIKLQIASYSVYIVAWNIWLDFVHFETVIFLSQATYLHG